MLEIELKVRVDSLDLIRQNLLARHAKFLGKQHEHDIYYNAPHRDFGSTDEALRSGIPMARHLSPTRERRSPNWA